MADTDAPAGEHGTDADASPEIIERLHQAEALRRQELWAQAHALFAQVIAEKPNNVTANVGAGRCAWSEGELDLALRHFTLASRTVGYIWPLMQFANGCRKAGQLDIAQTAYRRAAEQATGRADPLFGLAACSRERDDAQAAAEFQARACALEPGDLAALVELGRDFRKLGRLDEAAAIAAKALALLPDMAPALKLAEAVARDREKSRRSAKRKREAPVVAATETDPADSDPSPELAKLLKQADELRREGQIASAEALFAQVLAVRPRHVPGNLGAGRCAWALGKLDQALAHFITAAEGSENVGPLLYFASVCRKAGQSGPAEAAWRRATELSPNRPEPWLGLAASARGEDQLALAAELQARACAVIPDDAAAQVDLARDLRGLGRLDEASEVLDAVLAKQPELSPAIRLASAIARDRDNAERAARRASRRGGTVSRLADTPDANGAITSTPETEKLDVARLLHEAEELRRQGRLSDADSAFRQLVMARPNNVNAQLGAGRCAWAQARLVDALIHFTTAARLSQKVSPLLHFATGCRKSGQLDVAASGFKAAADLAPQWAEPVLGLAACARGRGEREAAAHLQARATELAPDDLQAQVDLAKDLRDLHRLTEAAAVLDAVLARQPTLAPALRLAATIARDGDHSDRAADLLQQAAVSQAEPEAGTERNALVRARPLLQFAADCRKAGRLEVAETSYRRAAELLPDRPEPVLGLAACARRRGAVAEAASFQAQACALAPEDLRARVDLGRDLRELGRLDEAAAVLDAVLDQDPSLPQALRIAAAVARDRRNTDRAAKLLQQASVAEPEATGSMVKRITAYRDRGETEAALELAEQVLAREPRHVAALVQLGLLRKENDEPEAALEAFERAYAEEPGDVTIALHLARELRAAGLIARSDTVLDQALALDTQGTQALSYRAEQALAGNDPATALACYDTAIGRAPAQLGLYIGASNALARMGRIGDGLDRLADAAARCEDTPLLHTRRAQLLRQAGRYPEALAVCEAALTVFPRSFPLWESALHLRILIGETDDTTALLHSASFDSEEDQAAIAGMLGDVAMDQGDIAAAIAAYRRAADMQPADQSFQGNLARAYLARFDLPAAGAQLHQLQLLRASSARRRLRTTHATQSFLETLLNEYRIDAAAQAGLAALPESPDARIEGLVRLCRDFPDNTMLAAALLDALWVSGALSNVAPTAGACAIPRQLMQFWDDPAPPADVIDLMQSWRDAVPAGAYDRFTDQRARRFLADHFDSPVVFAYHRGATLSVKSDLFRLAWLAQAGGVYADAFDRRIGPLEPLLPEGADLVLYRGELGLLSNGFIAARPGHPMLHAALAEAAASVNRGDKDLVWLATGPGLITRCFTQFLVSDPKTLPDRLSRTCIWPRHAITRRIALHCLAEWKVTFQPRNTSFTKRAYELRGPATRPVFDPDEP